MWSCEGQRPIHQFLAQASSDRICRCGDGPANCVYHAIAEDRLVLITANREPYRSLCAQRFPAGRFGPAVHSPGAHLRYPAGDGGLPAPLRTLPEVLHPVAEIDNPEAIKSSVSRGHWGLRCFQLSVREELAGGKLLSFDLDAEGVFRKIYLTWRKDTALTMVEQGFIDYVRKSARKIG